MPSRESDESPQQMAVRLIRPLFLKHKEDSQDMSDESEESAEEAMALFIADIRHYCDAKGYDYFKALNEANETYSLETRMPFAKALMTALEKATCLSPDVADDSDRPSHQG